MIVQLDVSRYGDSLSVAKELRDMVAERFPDAEIYIAPIGPVIGAHAGPGVMTVFSGVISTKILQ